MKKLVSLIIITFLCGNRILAQNPQVDRIAVPLSDPSKPAIIDVGLMNGGITVKGYSGKEILVEATTQMEKLREEKNEKAKEKSG